MITLDAVMQATGGVIFANYKRAGKVMTGTIRGLWIGGLMGQVHI